MAKNTSKNDALSMFNNTTPVKISSDRLSTPASKPVPEEPKAKEIEEPITKKEVPETVKQTETPVEPKTEPEVINNTKETENIVQKQPQAVEPEKLKKESTKKEKAKSTETSSPIGLTLTMNKKAKNMHNRSFYLDDGLYNKFVKMAKSNGSSASEYLSFILEQILQ